MPKCVIQVRMDENIKKKVDALFDNLGFDTPTAIRIFLAQSLQAHGLPFNVKQSDSTIENFKAIDETGTYTKTGQAKSFKNVDDIFEDLEI